MRIKLTDLEFTVNQINNITKSSPDTWVKRDGKLCANIGNYHIDSAYGGHKLCRIVSEGGGVKDVIHTGFTTKRELYVAMQSYISGLIDSGAAIDA